MFKLLWLSAHLLFHSVLDRHTRARARTHAGSKSVNHHLSSTSLDFPSASCFRLQKRSKITDFLLLHLWLELSSNSNNLNHLLLLQKKKKKGQKNPGQRVAVGVVSPYLLSFLSPLCSSRPSSDWLLWISKLDVCRRWMSKQSQTKQCTRRLTLA